MELFESDITLNTNLQFGDATLNPNVFDIQNILTHELGHSLSLGDITNPLCSSVTMYLYSSQGETSKRTLEKPDIKGLRKIY